LMGVWWGAVIVVYLPTEWAASLAGDLHANQLVSANLAIIIFGLVLVVMMLVAPSGIQGGLRWFATRLATYFSANTVTHFAGPLRDPLPAGNKEGPSSEHSEPSVREGGNSS